MKLSKEDIKERGMKVNVPFGKKKSLVYTTFKLSPDVHTIIKEIARERMLTQADVFDAMMGMIVDYPEECVMDAETDLSGLSKTTEHKRTRKTYALTAETIAKINAFVREKKIQRDSFINATAILFKLVLDLDLEESREKYPAILKNDIEPLWIKVEELHEKVSNELECDPVADRIGLIVTQFKSLATDMERAIADGAPMEVNDKLHHNHRGG